LGVEAGPEIHRLFEMPALTTVATPGEERLLRPFPVHRRGLRRLLVDSAIESDDDLIAPIPDSVVRGEATKFAAFAAYCNVLH
jgi:hypothetical protein